MKNYVRENLNHNENTKNWLTAKSYYFQNRNNKLQQFWVLSVSKDVFLYYLFFTSTFLSKRISVNIQLALREVLTTEHQY